MDTVVFSLEINDVSELESLGLSNLRSVGNFVIGECESLGEIFLPALVNVSDRLSFTENYSEYDSSPL